jgi:hypothetical protein
MGPHLGGGGLTHGLLHQLNGIMCFCHNGLNRRDLGLRLKRKRVKEAANLE